MTTKPNHNEESREPTWHLLEIDTIVLAVQLQAEEGDAHIVQVEGYGIGEAAKPCLVAL